MKVFISLVLILTVFVVAIALPLTYGQKEKYFFTLHLNLFEGIPYPELVSAVEVLQYELEKIGIELVVHYVDVAVWVDKLLSGKIYEEGGFDMGVNAWSGGVDPSWLSLYFHSKGGRTTWSNYDNGRFDALMDEGIKEINVTKRKEIYQEGVKIMIDDAAIMPFVYNTMYNVRNKKIENWVNDPGLREAWAGGWTVEGKTYDDDVTVVYGNTAPPVNLHPFFSISGASSPPRAFCGIDSLVWYVPSDGTFIGNLATSWEQSEDGLTWTFHLRDNAYWHDGVKFTAEDVKFSLDAMMDPEAGTGWIEYLSSVESTEIVDDYTVKVHLKYAYPPFLFDVGEREIAAKHVLDGVAVEDWRSHWSNTERAIGTGPYKFVKWVPDEYIEFEANPNWWGGKVFIDHLFLKFIPEVAAGFVAVKKGEVDILNSYYNPTPEDYVELVANPDLEVTRVFRDGFKCFEFNHDHPILTNKWVRKAITLCFPAEHFVEDVMGNMTIVATQPVSPMCWAYDESLTPLPYDIDKAKEYMETAGYKYEYITPTPIPFVTQYVIPAAFLIVGLGVGLAAGYYITRKRRPT